MSAGFFLATPQQEKSSIQVIVRHKGQRFKKGIGVSVETKHWNPASQRSSANKRYPHGEIVNIEIEKWRGAIERAIFKATKESIDLSDQKMFWFLVSQELGETDYSLIAGKQHTFVEYFERVFLPRFLETKSFTRIRRFNVIIHKLKEFEQATGKHYKLDEIGLPFYREFQQYLNGLKHSANYFGTFVKIIKQVMKEAELIDKLHTNHEYLHSDFKATSQDVDEVYLSEEELLKIFYTDIGKKFIKRYYPRTVSALAPRVIHSYNVVKNRFLIGAYTGLRVSDFNNLDLANIKGDFLSVITEKTGEKVIIPLHPVLKGILGSEGFSFEDKLSDDKTRKYIKLICKFAKINDKIQVRESVGGKVEVKTYEKWELVGNHTARRSFATNAFKAGVPTISIMKITGHKKESTFMRYIRISQEENAEMLANHPFFAEKPAVPSK